MTELEATNILLSVIGEAPISQLPDLSSGEISDSALGRRALAEVSRDVQSEGWSWNTDRGVSLTKTNGQFTVPANTLHVHFNPNRYQDRLFAVRGNRVWDPVNQTYDIDLDDLEVDQHVVLLDWDDLPHQAQQYIVIRAARIYADRYLNSSAIYTYTSQDEEYARSMLVRAEQRGQRNNMLWGNSEFIGRGRSYSPWRGTLYRRN